MKHISILLRMIILIFFVVGTYLLMPGIRIDNSIERWLPLNSDETIKYKQFLEEFNSDALLILSIENTDSSLDQIEIKKRIQSVKNLEYVLNVTSWPSKSIRHKRKNHIDFNTYIIRFKPKSFLNPNRPELLNRIDEIFKDLDNRVHLAGTGVIHRAINDQTEKAMSNYLLAGIGLLFIVLAFLIRSPISILQIMLVALGGVSSIIYASRIFDIPISLVHTIIPIVILFYSTSISLHILYHSGNFRKVIMPSLMVLLTTSIGFSIFLFDKAPLLNDFAILGLAGLIGTFFWSLVIFYPKVYTYNVPKNIKIFFEKIPVLKTQLVIPLFIVIISLLIPGLFKIKAEIHSLSILSPNNKAYKDHGFIESNVGYYFPLEYILNEEKISRRQISVWVNEVYKLNEVGAVIAYYQIPKFINKRSLGYQSKKYDDVYRITFMIPLLSTSEGIQLANNIKNISHNYFENYEPEISGFITLYSNVANGLTASFKKNLLFAFITIFIVIMIYLRNLKLILFTLIANIFPIIVMLGLMGWFGINLDMVTIPIGCLMISIVVDDTIHIMYWYKTRKNLKEALVQAGPGIFFTSLLLGLGFSVLLLTNAPPVKYFAVLSLFTIGAALIGDMVLLPSLLKNG